MKKALLVIDFINEIVHQDGKLGASFSENIKKNSVMEKANKAIQYARAQAIQVIHVKVGFDQNYAACPENSPIFGGAKENQILQLNTWATEFHEIMDVREEDHIIVKHRISAFYNTDLECVLRAKKIDELVICGVSTDMAVEAASRDAHDRDYNVVVLNDACGAETDEIHSASIINIKRIASVLSVDEWISL